jgi:hypothetical protein
MTVTVQENAWYMLWMLKVNHLQQCNADFVMNTKKILPSQSDFLLVPPFQRQEMF